MCLLCFHLSHKFSIPISSISLILEVSRLGRATNFILYFASKAQLYTQIRMNNIWHVLMKKFRLKNKIAIVKKSCLYEFWKANNMLTTSTFLLHSNWFWLVLSPIKKIENILHLIEDSNIVFLL